MIDSITGVVLAGGKSSRMGKNKTLLPYHEKALIFYPLETLSNIFSRVRISASDTELPAGIEEFPKITDRYAQTGPLGGILSVLETEQRDVFCVACDMPFINVDLVRKICEFKDFECVIPLWNGRAQVLHAFYSISLVQRMQIAIRQNTLKITDALKGANIHFLAEKEVSVLDPTGRSFRNLNTPDDYQQFIRDC